jgi:hypothetical protein
MPDWSLVRSPHVVMALEECDRLGHKDFLGRYGFRRARAYTLWHRGNEYDSMAVLSAAYLRATGQVLTWDDHSGGEQGAATVLKGLGFDVVAEEQPFVSPRARKAATPRTPTARTRAGTSTPAAKATTAKATTAKPRTTKAPPARTRTAKTEPVVAICPSCHTALPATGVCDYCE